MIGNKKLMILYFPIKNEIVSIKLCKAIPWKPTPKWLNSSTYRAPVLKEDLGVKIFFFNTDVVQSNPFIN